MKKGGKASKPFFSPDKITFSIWLEEKEATFSTVDGMIEVQMIFDESK